MRPRTEELMVTLESGMNLSCDKIGNLMELKQKLPNGEIIDVPMLTDFYGLSKDPRIIGPLSYDEIEVLRDLHYEAWREYMEVRHWLSEQWQETLLFWLRAISRRFCEMPKDYKFVVPDLTNVIMQQYKEWRWTDMMQDAREKWAWVMDEPNQEKFEERRQSLSCRSSHWSLTPNYYTDDEDRREL